MRVQPWYESLPAHLRELGLAKIDIKQQVIEPTVLIGLDLSWDFMTGGVYSS